MLCVFIVEILSISFLIALAQQHIPDWICVCVCLWIFRDAPFDSIDTHFIAKITYFDTKTELSTVAVCCCWGFVSFQLNCMSYSLYNVFGTQRYSSYICFWVCLDVDTHVKFMYISHCSIVTKSTFVLVLFVLISDCLVSPFLSFVYYFLISSRSVACRRSDFFPSISPKIPQFYSFLSPFPSHYIYLLMFCCFRSLHLDQFTSRP